MAMINNQRVLLADRQQKDHQPLVKSPETQLGAKPVTVFARAIDLKSENFPQ
jgi:hypothetical protein